MKKHLIVFVLLIISSLTSFPQVVHVPDDQPTIQAGIDAAENGDTVLVAEGTYYENIRIENKALTLASHFLLDDDTSHISKTIINGSQQANSDLGSTVGVSNSPDTTVICGLTITGGFGDKVPMSATEWARIAAGVIISASNIIICYNRIINNIIDENTVPDDYTGAAGGGIGINPMGVENLMVHIKNNLISENKINGVMASGGGIFLSLGSSKISYLIEDNVISNNICTNTSDYKAMGGGISLDLYLPTNGTQIIRNNIISNNQAICDNTVTSKHSFGGGMYILIMESTSNGSVDNDPGPYIYNNIICGNYSDYLGGGISVWRVYWPIGSSRAYKLSSEGHYTPKPSFINNTFFNNSAEVDGAAFYIMNHKPFLMNNILWDTYPDNAEWGEIFLGDETWWTANVEQNNYGGAKMFYNNIQGGWDADSGNISYDPIFADSLFNLSEGSHCVGNGIVSIDINGIPYISPTTDFYGNIRPNPIDAYVDIGAIESPYSQVVSVQDPLMKLPTEFTVSQNYPNPFNPATTIKYSLPRRSEAKTGIPVNSRQSSVGSMKKQSFNLSRRSNTKPDQPIIQSNSSGFVLVELVIYDILGREVATLVNEQQRPGNYEVKWVASGQASGIYFYKITAGEFIETKKMLLIK